MKNFKRHELRIMYFGLGRKKAYIRLYYESKNEWMAKNILFISYWRSNSETHKHGIGSQRCFGAALTDITAPSSPSPGERLRHVPLPNILGRDGKKKTCCGSGQRVFVSFLRLMARICMRWPLESRAQEFNSTPGAMLEWKHLYGQGRLIHFWSESEWRYTSH